MVAAAPERIVGPRMTVVLLASSCQEDDQGVNLPLGLVSLGTVLQRECARDVAIVPLPSEDATSKAARDVAGAILEHDPEWVGISTMCNTFALSLMAARELKRQRPGLPVVLGGPHATVTASKTLAAFDFVDLVAQGEYESAIVDLQSALDGRMPVSEVPGLAYRQNGRPQTRGQAPVVDIDALPLPDYGLVSWRDRLTSIPIDAGRGCPFSCTYCSTNRFFRNRYRLRSLDGLLELLRWSIGQTGVKKYTFVHDNLTVNSLLFDEFCRRLIAEDLGIAWTCSARPDCLDAARISLMRDAGCTGVFMGVESGSERVQREIKKRLRMPQVSERVSELRAAGLDFTCSFIVGFPTESSADMLATFDTMADVRELGGGNETVQLHMLSPTPATPLFEQWRDRLRPIDAGTRLLSNLETDFVDVARRDPDCTEWIAQHPDIFGNHYYLENLQLRRSYVLAAHALVRMLHMVFPSTARLLRSSERAVPSPLDVVELFEDHLDTDYVDAMEVAEDVYLNLLQVLDRWDSADALRVRDVLRVERAVARLRSDRVPYEWVGVGWDVAAWLTAVGSVQDAWDASPDSCVVLVAKQDGEMNIARMPDELATLLGQSEPDPPAQAVSRTSAEAQPTTPTVGG